MLAPEYILAYSPNSREIYSFTQTSCRNSENITRFIKIHFIKPRPAHNQKSEKWMTLTSVLEMVPFPAWCVTNIIPHFCFWCITYESFIKSHWTERLCDVSGLGLVCPIDVSNHFIRRLDIWSRRDIRSKTSKRRMKYLFNDQEYNISFPCRMWRFFQIVLLMNFMHSLLGALQWRSTNYSIALTNLFQI